MPWRSEQEDINAKNFKLLYKQNQDIIQCNHLKYSIISDEQMDELLKESEKLADDDFEDNEFNEEQGLCIDLFDEINERDKNKKDKHKSQYVMQFTIFVRKEFQKGRC